MSHPFDRPHRVESDPRPLTLGVFDSGVGGLSVLRALHFKLPDAHVIYVADSGHAPYGERDDAYVLERSDRIATHLLEDSGCQGLVIACNTATAAAVTHLRSRWPSIPLVGVEPGVKPAVAASRNKRIGVMATTGTLRSQRFQGLIAAYAGDAVVIPQPCPGLALAIEQGDLHAPAVTDLLASYCQALTDHKVDTVVLGCTHYAFVHPQIQALLGPEVLLVDTAEAVAQQAVRLLAPGPRSPANGGPGTGRIELQTTGDAAQLSRIAQRWLPFPVTTRSLVL
jgi:glutamate racemase